MESIEYEIEIIEKAELLYESGRYKLALDTLHKLDTKLSSYGLLQYCTVYTNCCISLGEANKALESISSKLYENPNSSYLLYLLSFTQSSMDKSYKSLDSILKAIEIDPKTDYYHSHASSIYFDLGKYEKSEYHLAIAEELDPTSIKSIYLRALHFIRRNDQKNAKATIQRGLELFPNSTLLHNLFTNLDTSFRPKASTIKEISLNALEQNPFDTNAKDSLLFSIKNSNALVRFFVSNGFGRYKIDWTPWRVILMIFFWKGTLIWGVFGLLYLIITWAGTAVFYSIIRKHPKYKYLLSQKNLNMSNAFLGAIGITFIGVLIVLRVNPEAEIQFASFSGFLFLILITISFFEIDSKKGKVAFSIFVIISTFLLYSTLTHPIIFGVLSILLLLVYAFLFTLNITFK